MSSATQHQPVGLTTKAATSSNVSVLLPDYIHKMHIPSLTLTRAMQDSKRVAYNI